MSDIFDCAEIERKLQYVFKDKGLLLQAFTHSSFANVENVRDNERMEFLGDAILDMIVSEYFFERFSEREAGQLSIMRANVVSSDGLQPIVEHLDVLKYLQVSNGAGQVKRVSKKIEANLFEAIVCAIYLDGGIDAAKQFVLRVMCSSLDDAVITTRKDDKTLIQEYCQKNHLPTPIYKLIERSGSDNAPTYKCGLYIDNKLISEGIGSNKKSAEQSAAKIIVTKWRIE